MPKRCSMDLGEVTALSPADLRAIPAFRSVIAYFDAKTGGTRLPSRADIVPADLKPHLPKIFIWDMDTDTDGTVHDIRIRLLGTEVAYFYGESTGVSFLDYPEPGVAERAFAVARRMMETPAVMGYRVRGITTEKRHVALYVCYVPLSTDGVHVNQVFGCIHCDTPA